MYKLNPHEMTRNEFIEIVESNDKNLIKTYLNDSEFLALAEQMREEAKQMRDEQTKIAQKRIDDINKSVSDLIEKNKNTVSNPKILSLNPKMDDRDYYEDTLDSFCREPETKKGNVLVCTNYIDKSTLVVNGMYQNVKVMNFGGEVVFISDGQTINAFGDGDNTDGHEELEVVLSFLDCNVMYPGVKIDPNVFNTGADYFVLINEY